AILVRFTRFLAVFEIYTPSLVLRTSEVLSDFQIVVENRQVYLGKAVVSSLVNVGSNLVCEAKLEGSWLAGEILGVAANQAGLQSSYDHFFKQWQTGYKILPEYKLLIADMQMFLTDLRLWLDQVELGIRGLPNGDRSKAEREVVQQLVQPVS